MVSAAGRFERANRLLRSREFRYVAQHGRRLRAGRFVVVVASRDREEAGRGARLGITVSQRVGKAVARNRVKRRIRAWFRQEWPRIPQNLDIVVVAQPGAAESSAGETAEALRRAMQAARGMS